MLQVVVPVFNALEFLEKCLASITRTVPRGTRVLLIDDASTDERVLPLLQSWASQDGTGRELLVNGQNLGFVATANRGLRQAVSSVVLLNSDTEVTDGWLERLEACLASDDAIATATPWSNNGEIVSIPAFCRNNAPPRDADAVARAVRACGRATYPDIPTAVGFCMAISKQAIGRVGLFDEQSFGKGYGEENDFCMRAAGFGFRNVLCDDAYVVHHGGGSFAPLGLQPDEHSMRRLLQKHPAYQEQISEFIRRDPLAGRRATVVACLEGVL